MYIQLGTFNDVENSILVYFPIRTKWLLYASSTDLNIIASTNCARRGNDWFATRIDLFYEKSHERLPRTVTQRKFGTDEKYIRDQSKTIREIYKNQYKTILLEDRSIEGAHSSTIRGNALPSRCAYSISITQWELIHDIISTFCFFYVTRILKRIDAWYWYYRPKETWKF